MKTSMVYIAIVTGIVVIAIAATGYWYFYGSKSTATTVQVKVKPSPQTLSILATTKPTYLGIKFVAIYVAQDIDTVTQNNIGSTEMVYLNPECGNNIGNCDIDPGQRAITIEKFFDFSKPVDEVNAEIKSLAMPVKIGTYKYLRMEFCRRGSDLTQDEIAAQKPNMEFKIDGMSESYKFKVNACSTTIKLDPPLVLTTGQNVFLNLEYDISELVNTYDGAQSGNNCTQVAPFACLQNITFKPSISIK